MNLIFTSLDHTETDCPVTLKGMNWSYWHIGHRRSAVTDAYGETPYREPTIQSL